VILLDTNVISELMKPKPTVRVVDWVSEQNPGSLFISTITQAEILYGIALLSSWKRKSSLTKSALIMFKEDFEGRILSFDIEASIAYADIASSRRKSGKPISQYDAQISAIAKSRGLKIATRNTRDFENCGIVLINPWD
tara:strand:- start:22519 stop:22935 length:417 start_codon:yes stop_codon:yes gene_type:complete